MNECTRKGEAREKQLKSAFVWFKCEYVVVQCSEQCVRYEWNSGKSILV